LLRNREGKRVAAGPEQRRSSTALIKALNPTAHMVEAEFGGVPLEAILDTRRFDFEHAQEAAGWSR